MPKEKPKTTATTNDGCDVIVRLDISPSHHPAVVKGDLPGAIEGRVGLETLYLRSVRTATARG